MPKFKNLIKKESVENGINSAILLYKFQYDAEKVKDTYEDLEFIFIGAVPYNS